MRVILLIICIFINFYIYYMFIIYKTMKNLNLLMIICKPIIDIDNFDKVNTFNKKGIPPTLTGEFYMINILKVLITGISWDDLDLFDIGCTGDAIRKKFTLWVKRGYFSKFEKMLLMVYHDYKKKYEPDNNILLMDSTTIININCLSEYTGKGIKFRGKQAVTIHSIVDTNKIMYVFILKPANIHDVTQVPNLVESSIIPIYGEHRKPIYLAADKAYTSQQLSIILKDLNIILTCPLKIYKNNKHPKKKLSIIKEDALNKRIAVEHSYNILKRSYKRINNLYDKEIDIFTAFIQLANSIEISKFLIKKGINFNINLNDQ